MEQNKRIVNPCPFCGSTEVRDMAKEFYEYEDVGGFFKAMGRVFFKAKPPHKYICMKCERGWDKENLIYDTPEELLEAQRILQINEVKSKVTYYLLWGVLLLIIAIFAFQYCWSKDAYNLMNARGLSDGSMDLSNYHETTVWVGLIFLISGIWAVVWIIKSQRYRRLERELKADSLQAESSSQTSNVGKSFVNNVFRRSQKVQSIDELKKAAWKGNTKAMISLGDRFLHERPDWAIYWYEKAKKNGATVSKEKLDQLGKYRSIDELKKEAQKGDTNAMIALGDRLLSTRPDWAVYWYDRAAKEGNAEAKIKLRNMGG